MKRLLAYLFIVLGFGLTFNVNAKAKGKHLCFIDWPSNIDYGNYQGLKIPVDKVVFIKRLKYDDGSSCHLKIFASDNEKLYKKIIWSAFQDRKLYEVDGKKMSLRWLPYKTLLKIHKDQNLKMVKFNISKPKTQIAKAEQGQKEKDMFNANDIAALLDKAKEESQLVEDQVVKTSNKPSLTLSEEDKLKAHIFGCWSIPLGLPFDKDLMVRIKLKLKRDGSISSTEILDHKNIKEGYYKVLSESALRAVKLCQPLPVPIGDYERVKELQLNFDAREMLDGGISSDTQIAKVEPTIKPKKKVKVSKVEPKQEEFKPKKTNQDNEAPVIEIAEAITVDSQVYILKGKVKDKSNLSLFVNGRNIDVKRGKFEIEGFVVNPDQVEEIKIVARDQWNNKSEKTVKLKVEFKQVANVRSYEKPNPGKIKAKKNNNRIGIIIGIEKYQALENKDAPFANNDANAFRSYATRALGIPNKNLKVLIDDKATRAGLLKSLKIWLPQITRGESKDIYIFFAGHGLSSDDGKDLHILPQDGDPILLEDTAISRVEMFNLINKVNPNSVTMFFDTCYSGPSRSGEMLIAGLRPVRIIANEQEKPDNFTIFSASNYDQTSGSIDEAKHGIFSYYLMKGLEGKADSNKDKNLTNGELIAYLKSNVSQEAFSQNRSQEPMLAGDPDKILMSYR